MRAERETHPRRTCARARASTPTFVALPAILAGVYFAAGLTHSAHAAITQYSAEHEIRLNSQQPFTSNIFRDFTSGPALGANPFTWSKTQGFGQFEVRATQDLIVTPDRVEVDLSATMFDVGSESGGIAASTLEIRLTLDAPANLFVSGSANGPTTSFAGGHSIALTPVAPGSPPPLFWLNSLGALNYAADIASPIALAAGRYDLVMTNSLANKAVGTRTNSAILQFVTTASQAGDLSGNGQVEQSDLDLVLQNWGGSRGNWSNATGFNTTQVDQEELDAVLTNWGSTGAPSFATNLHAVPEPAGLAYALAGAMLRYRVRTNAFIRQLPTR